MVSPFDAASVVLRLALGFWLLWRIVPPPGGRRRPTCSVIIPARDEAGSLPAALGAIRPQLRPGDEVIVVDDHSSDRTAEVAALGGAVVLAADELPPGWTGKSFACATGAAAATGSVLCFVDADTTLAPGGLDRMVSTQASLGGMVSACPYHRVERAYEHLSAFFNVISLMGTDAHSPIGGRRRPNGAYGPALAVSADDYRRVGGHTAVAGEVLEDVRLGQHWQAAGLPVHLYAGPLVASYRMYPGGPRDLADGWTKNFASGAGTTRLVTLALIVAWLSLPLQAAWWVLGLALPAPPAPAAIAAAVYLVAATQFWWMVRRVGSFGVGTAALFPIPLAAFMAVFVRSAVLTVTRRSVRWKGRMVPTVAGR